MIETKIIQPSWRDIFRALKMAFDIKKLFLGYLGILASIAWCVTAVAFFSALKLISTTPHTFTKLILFSAKEGISTMARNLLSTIMPLDFAELFVFAVLIFGFLAIWSFVGGAITRLAVLDYARDDSLPLLDALKFAKKKFWSYFWSPLIPIIGVIFFALCNVFYGLIGRIPIIGELAIGLGFPVALASSLLMIVIGVIGALGACFMFPTISAEGSDAFDAMSRAYSYVISRPRQFLLYCTINAVYGILCLSILAFVAWLTIKLSLYTVNAGMGEKFNAMHSFISQKCSIECLGFCTNRTSKISTIHIQGWSLKFLASMLIIYIVLIKLAVWTILITYWLSAKTIIYFILRKEIDSTNVSDVYIEEPAQSVL